MTPNHDGETPLLGSDPLITSGRPPWWAMPPNHEWETPTGGDRDAFGVSGRPPYGVVTPKSLVGDPHWGHGPHWGGWETPLWGGDPQITSGRPHWWAMPPNHEWETPLWGW